ncbi:unnamed protein product [Calypogeia fissa]
MDVGVKTGQKKKESNDRQSDRGCHEVPCGFPDAEPLLAVGFFCLPSGDNYCWALVADWPGGIVERENNSRVMRQDFSLLLVVGYWLGLAEERRSRTGGGDRRRLPACCPSVVVCRLATA